MMSTENAHLSIETITLLGVRIHLLTETRLHEYIADVISQNRRALVLNVNAHCYNIVHHNPWLRDYLNQSDITFCDGAGVVLGAIMTGQRIPYRFTYADSIWRLAELSEKRGFTIYFLGAKHGIADKAAKKLTDRFPNLKIKTHHGYFDKSADSEENRKIVDQINASKSNILFVGFGMPLQERWLKENWDKLNVNVAFSSGALFDFVSEELQRGPKWMTDNSLEWLARLIIEPKRLWRRYIIGNTLFIYRVLKEWFRKNR